MDGTPAGRSLQDRPLQSRDRANPVPQRTHRPHEWNCSRRSNHRGIPATAWSAGDPPLEQNPASLPPPIQQENHSIGGCFHTAWVISGPGARLEFRSVYSSTTDKRRLHRVRFVPSAERRILVIANSGTSHWHPHRPSLNLLHPAPFRDEQRCRLSRLSQRVEIDIFIKAVHRRPAGAEAQARDAIVQPIKPRI